MKKLVFLTGAGMSVESGFKTFRGNDGLWENYPVEQIATHEGWEADPTLVTNFYNMLRHKLYAAQPNEGHKLIKDLEKDFDVTVITQNVDNLHEKAGSKNVIHLHGELSKVCSSRDPYDYRYIKELPENDCEVEPGTKAGDGSLLRPFIVFFGESVPMIEPAAEAVKQADIFGRNEGTERNDQSIKTERGGINRCLLFCFYCLLAFLSYIEMPIMPKLWFPYVPRLRSPRSRRASRTPE